MTTLNSRFQSSISQLSRVFGSEIIKQMDGQITGTQLYMLYYIREFKRCRLTELVERMEVKPSAVTVMIDRLEKSDFVKRVSDMNDRRVILVELTDTGHDILRRAQAIREDIVGSYMKKLSTEEAQLVTDILEKMVRVEQ
ncbi:MarR family transcriptional regulator [Paenibacillus sp. GSMTC-2017]|uniref:MarR family winged helix-turn-helix transcriptional regulator n=1 Tax=Paenibacillus sp. GSMTC-2017 TaxID=2794350 RepID=UPI0018D93B78|nr:MarR family transcriptional regulator [Paenibacillus sp. GSMTC-2017]MBH5317688.1 MarR family transcriptional regulator [Paenibacillus sp. GSMTC-2017]